MIFCLCLLDVTHVHRLILISTYSLQYVHDTPGEGMYIGTSHYYKDDKGTSMCHGKTWAQPELKGVHIYNNKVEDVGRDAIKVGSAVEDVTVHHNTIKRFAYKQDYGDANAIGMNPGSTGMLWLITDHP